jgi:hypothetical protein
MRLSIHLLLAICCAGIAGCGTLRGGKRTSKDSSPEAQAPRAVAVKLPPVRVGIVTLVNEQDRFVIVDVGKADVPPSGTALKTFRDRVETGALAVGDVRRRPFIVGDIVKGAPQKGDEVFK